MEDPAKITVMEDIQVDKKAKRRRLKKLCIQIREQMDFYFSDSNLHKDRFIKQKINESPDGYIDLQIFAKFNRLRQLTTDMDLVAKALSTSTLLQVSEDGKKVRRTKPVEEPKDIDDRTVYVEYIPPTADHDWVRRVFTPFGNMSYISLPRYRSTGDMKGFAFVEFETADEAAKACEAYNNEAISSCRPGRFPRANKQMKLLMRQVEAKRSELSTQMPGEMEATPNGKKKRCKRTTSDSSSVGPDSVSETNEASTGGKPCKRRHTCTENSTEDNEIAAKKEAVSDDEKHGTNNSTEEKTVEQEQADTDNVGPSNQKENTADATVATKTTPANVEDGSSSEEIDETAEVKAKEKDVVKKEEKPVNRELLPGTGGLKRKGSGMEAGEVKKVRISEDVQVHSAGQLTKHKRRRQKVKATVKELPELRVIPKLEWLQLKKEYLELQQKNMHDLKETLQQLRAEERRQVELAAEKTTKSKVEFVPGVILRVTSKEAMTRKQMKAQVGCVTEVAYIDLIDGNTEGHIRCVHPDGSQKIVMLTSDQFNFSLLTGEEEENYWNKLAADREKKLSTKSRQKKRGRNKVAGRAEKASNNTETKHKFFDDDEDKNN